MQPTNLMPWETNLSIGTTAVLGAIPANPTRKGLVITNNGADPVNVTFGGNKMIMTSQGVAILPPDPPTSTTGIQIAAGQSLTLPPAQTPAVALGAQLNMIAGAAATPVSVLEF